MKPVPAGAPSAPKLGVPHVRMLPSWWSAAKAFPVEEMVVKPAPVGAPKLLAAVPDMTPPKALMLPSALSAAKDPSPEKMETKPVSRGVPLPTQLVWPHSWMLPSCLRAAKASLCP